MHSFPILTGCPCPVGVTGPSGGAAAGGGGPGEAGRGRPEEVESGGTEPELRPTGHS